MPSLTAHRATIAGVGTTAVMLAAVITVSLLVGGLVAYTASPAGPLVTGPPSLALPQTAADTDPGAAGRSAPLVLPPAPLAATIAASAGVPVADAPAPTVGAAPATSGLATSTESSPGASTASAGPAATTPTQPQPAASPAQVAPVARPEPVRTLTGVLADTTASTGQGLGGALKATTDGLGTVVEAVIPSLGQTLKQVGLGASTVVSATTDVLAAIVRRLGGDTTIQQP